MRSRVNRYRRRRQKPKRDPYHGRYTAIGYETLPPRVDNEWKSNYSLPPTRKNYGRTRSIYRRKPRQDTLFSPYSKTVLRRRFLKTMGTHVGNVRRGALLGQKNRTPGRRNICTQRAARTAVLFLKKLVGFPGSSPGKRGKYRRSVDSDYSCK